MPNNDEDPRSQPKFWIGKAAALLRAVMNSNTPLLCARW